MIVCVRLRKDCEVNTFGRGQGNVGWYFTSWLVELKGKRRVGRNCRLMLTCNIQEVILALSKNWKQILKKLGGIRHSMLKHLAEETKMSEKEDKSYLPKEDRYLF